MTRVTIVDDSEVVAEPFKAGLERKGFIVAVYTSPAQMLNEFEPDKFDVVILDFRIPGMNGVELYQLMRMVDESVRVCFVSAYADELRSALPNNELTLLEKPASISDLVKAVASP